MAERAAQRVGGGLRVIGPVPPLLDLSRAAVLTLTATSWQAWRRYDITPRWSTARGVLAGVAAGARGASVGCACGAA